VTACAPASPLETVTAEVLPRRPVRPATGRLDRFRGDVEGLRAVAVVAVVLFHAGVPGLTGGFVGVDVFFVLSGFLITGLLLDEVQRTGRVSLGSFWARRARRLLPLATLVHLTTLVGAWLVLTPLELPAVGRDALWAGAFGMNLLLAREGVDYHASDEPSLYQHYWSLGVEEQFYLVWPLVVAAVVAGSALLARRRARSAGTGPGTGVAGPVAVLAGVTALAVVASFVAGLLVTVSAQPMAYFLPWTRGWELGVGALLALVAPLLVRTPRAVREVLAVAGLVAVVAACLLLSEATPFPGTAALLPVLGTAAVVAAGTGVGDGRPTVLARALSVRPMQLVGRWSYGWYLWHWPVLLLGRRLLGGDPGLLTDLALAGLSLGLAALTHLLLEDPVRRDPRLSAFPRRSLALGAACVVAATVAGSAAATVDPRVRGEGPPATPVAEGPADPVEESEVVRAVATAESVETLPQNLRPAVEDAAEDVARARNDDGVSCMVAVEHTDITREPGGSCVFGDHPGSDTTVVLAGDSHAYQWFPALERIADEQRWRLVVLTKAGCPLWDVELRLQSLRRDYTECYEWREAALDRIEEEQPDLVVVSAAVFNPRGEDFTRRWADGVTRTTTELQERTGAEVVALQDTPHPGEDVPRCLAEHVDDVQECAASREKALKDPERRALTAQRAAASGAVVVDPVPWFCREECPAVIGNTPAYHDDDHITATYAEALAPLLEERLVAALRRG
jgi:peptidoglycan/LPS O-acetylase OafA/YrhL